MTGRYERQLATAFHELGYGVMRAPASGAATSRELPDILASNARKIAAPETPLAVELKATKSTTAYVDAAEIRALKRFADRFGATPLVGAKYKRPGGGRSRFWLVPPSAARITDSGTYGYPEATIEERATMVVLPGTTTTDAEVRTL